MYDKPRSSDDEKPWNLRKTFFEDWGWVIVISGGALAFVLGICCSR